MPRKPHKSKSKRSLFKSILYLFVPCYGHHGMPYDASAANPTPVIQPRLSPPIGEQEPCGSRSISQTHPEQEHDHPACSVAPTVSSDPCNNPCEAALDMNVRKTVTPPDPNPEPGPASDPQTPRLRISVESDKASGPSSMV